LANESQDKMVETLKQLRQRSPEISAAVITTADGFPVHTDSAGGVDADALAATAADLAMRASRMGEDLGLGQTGEIMVRAEHGYVVAVKVSDEFCLALTAKADSSLGLLLIGIRKMVAQLAETV
jgi:predicted regulator of Ras-like GTPase activity (Roadblock/LC7/MglB family)